MPSTAVVHSAPTCLSAGKSQGQGAARPFPKLSVLLLRGNECVCAYRISHLASHRIASHRMLLESSFVHFVRVLARRQQLPESHRQLPDSNAVYAYQNRKSPGADIAHANFSSRALGKKARLSMGESVRLHLHVATPCSARRTRNKQHHASNRRISAGTIYSYRALCTQQCELR